MLAANIQACVWAAGLRGSRWTGALTHFIIAAELVSTLKIRDGKMA